MERIIGDIGQGTHGNRFCFTMDNLDSHTNGAVQALIFNAGHRIVFRAPYHPVDGAIEYISIMGLPIRSFGGLEAALGLSLCCLLILWVLVEELIIVA